MEEEIEINIKPIDNYDLVTGTPIAPIDRLRVISANDYEDCIAEWCIDFLQEEYISVKALGGALDKGRDIVCLVDHSGIYDNYQCKHYSSKLGAADVWREFGKLVYYTYSGDIKTPRFYYLVSPHGLTPSLHDLIISPDQLKVGLLKNWDTHCKKKITAKFEIQLTDELKNHINDFDFSVIKELSPENFIEQYRKTKYFAIRFGGGLSRFRPSSNHIPLVIEEKELVYIQQLLQAYSDYKSQTIKTIKELESGYPELFYHLQDQRKSFYSSEALHRFVRDSLPNDQIFIELKDNIHDGLLEIVNDDYDNGYKRVKETLKEVCRIQLSSIIVSQPHFKFSTSDRKGLCHQLANEERFKWVKK